MLEKNASNIECGNNNRSIVKRTDNDPKRHLNLHPFASRDDYVSLQDNIFIRLERFFI